MRLKIYTDKKEDLRAGAPPAGNISRTFRECSGISFQYIPRLQGQQPSLVATDTGRASHLAALNHLDRIYIGVLMRAMILVVNIRSLRALDIASIAASDAVEIHGGR